MIHRVISVRCAIVLKLKLVDGLAYLKTSDVNINIELHVSEDINGNPFFWLQ